MKLASLARVSEVMRTFRVCSIAAIGWSLCASPASGAPTTWYDTKTLLASVRPAVLAELSAKKQLPPEKLALEDLPLYDLQLALEPDLGSFSVDETVYFTNRGATPLADLVFHVDANAGRPAGRELVRLTSANCLEKSCQLRRISPGTVRLVLSHALAPRERLRVNFRLQGHPEVIAASRTTLLGQSVEGLSAFGGGGSSPGSYGELALGDGILSLAHFYAALAARSGDHWDLADKNTMGDLGSDDVANVRASVELPAECVVAHVGSISESTTTLDHSGSAQHKKKLTILAGLVRDFTLVVSKDFELATRSVNGVEVSSYFRASEKRAGEQVLDAASFALRDFERRFGEYPYPRLDLAEAPLVGGAGGVEFSGLATIGSAFYKDLDLSALPGLGALSGLGASLGAGAGAPNIGANVTSGMREFVTAHEVAHQWWHVLVGSDSQTDPFADEGLAQYSTLIYFEDRYGAARAERELQQNLKLPYQAMRLAGQPDGAAERPVKGFTSPVAYGGLVYGKGPLFYREVRGLLGDDVFFARLRHYRADYAFEVAPTRAFVSAFSGAERGAVQLLASHWLDEAHGDEDLGKLDLAGLLQSFAPGLGAPKAGSATPLPANLPADLQQLLGGSGL